MKKFLLFLFIVAILGGSFYLLRNLLNKQNTVDNSQNISIDQGIDFCFYSKDLNNYGVYDKQYLVFNVKDNIAFGGYENKLSNSEIQAGDFYGTVSDFDREISGRKLDLIWSIQSGNDIREEKLIIHYGEGSAVAFFGEKVINQQGVYEYKNINNLKPGKTMSQIDCARLGEIQLVESYIVSNIKSLTSAEAVLGGSWYVVDVNVNTLAKSGEVLYEDGHIQELANFDYVIDDNGSVLIQRFLKSR